LMRQFTSFGDVRARPPQNGKSDFVNPALMAELLARNLAGYGRPIDFFRREKKFVIAALYKRRKI